MNKFMECSLRHNKHWTTEEKTLLRQIYPNGHLIAERLGRTLKAIAYQASQLGLTNDRTWTNNEIQLLKELYPIMPTREITQRLGRSIIGIQTKARRLGLPMDWTTHRKGNWEFVKENPYASLSETDKAYIAGFLDGEGSILLPSRKPRWRICLYNCHKGVLQWMANKIPYSKIYERPLRKSYFKEAWWLQLDGNLKVRALLKLLLPYLIVKKELAEACVASIESKRKEELEA